MSTITDEQIQLVKKTWVPMGEDLQGYGIKVFVLLFKIQPDLQKLFPFRDLHGDELLADKSFTNHAERFMRAVASAVNHLEELNQKMRTRLLALGGKHAKVQDFSVDYWVPFIDAFMQIMAELLKEEFTDDVKAAWHIVLKDVIFIMREGFVAEEQKKS